MTPNEITYTIIIFDCHSESVRTVTLLSLTKNKDNTLYLVRRNINAHKIPLVFSFGVVIRF